MKAMRFAWVACMTALASFGQAQPPLNPDFAAVKSKLEEGGTFYLYANLEGTVNGLIDSFEPFLRSSRESELEQIPARARQVVKGLGLDQLDDIGISVVRLSDDMGRMKSYLQLKERSGLFQLLGDAPYDLESVKFIPSDAVWACAQTLNAKAVFPLVDQIALSLSGPQGVANVHKGLEDVKARSNLDLPALANSLGKEIGFYLRLDSARPASLPLDQGMMLQIPTPSFAVLVSVKDRSLYDAVLGQLRQGKVSFQAAPSLEGLEIQALEIPDNPVGFKPVVAQGNGWMFFASRIEELNRLVEAYKTRRDLRASPEFQKLGAGLPTQINGVSFVSPRLSQEIQRALDQLADNPKLANAEGFAMIRNLLSPKLKSVGQVGVWINEPRGIYSISQGDVSAGDAVRTLAVAPVAVFAAIAVPNFLEAQDHSRVSRAQTDMRSMAVAIEAYYVDCNAYPAWTLVPAESARPTTPGEKPIPSFRLHTPNNRLLTLTTPIAYVSTYSADPFAESKATFGYYAPVGTGAQGWILFSPGPDGKSDLDWNLYDPSVSQPSPDLLRFSYDPTNGTVSSGDIWRVKQ